MATKIIYLLIPLMTPFVFFIAAQITYDYGVLGLLGYSAMWAISFIVVFLIKNKNGLFLNDLVLRGIVKTIYQIEIILCLSLVVKIILTETIPGYITFINITLLVIVISLFIAYLSKVNEKLVSIVTVLLGIALSFLIPILVYLKVSIPTVYSGLHFLSTDLLKFDRAATWWLIVSFGILLIVHQYLYRMTVAETEEHTKPGPFIMAGIIAAIVLISFGSISFLGSAQAVMPDLSDRVSIQVIQRFGGQFGQTLFESIIIFISFYLIYRTWQSIKGTTVKSIPISVGKYMFLPLLIVLYLDVTLLDVFMFAGLLWGPFLGIILLPSTSQALTRASLFFGLVMSFTFTVFSDSTIGIIVGAISSSVFMLGIRLLTFYKKKSSLA